MIEDMTSRDPRNDQCGEQPGPTLDATAALAKAWTGLVALANDLNNGVRFAEVAPNGRPGIRLGEFLAAQISVVLASHAAQADEIERLRAGDPLTNAVTHAHARAASAEAQITAQAETIKSLSEALEEARRIVVRQAAVSLTAKDVLAIVDAALSKALPETGEQSR